MKTNTQTYYTSELDFASALLAIGFKLRKNEPITRVIRDGGKHSDTYYFQSECESDFGRLSARLVGKVWRDENDGKVQKFKASNPEAAQVIDYLRTSMKNRALLLECIKANVKPMVHHRVGEKDCFLPLDASPELRAKMQRMIEEEA